MRRMARTSPTTLRPSIALLLQKLSTLLELTAILWMIKGCQRIPRDFLAQAANALSQQGGHYLKTFVTTWQRSACFTSCVHFSHGGERPDSLLLRPRPAPVT